MIALSNKSVVTIYPHIIPTDVLVLCACIKHCVKSAEYDTSLQANICSDDL